MADPKLVKLLKSSVGDWNAFIEKQPSGWRAILVDADLTDANLAGANLTCADLVRAKLWDADLTGAILVGANLTEAILINAALVDVKSAYANLTSANLTSINLSGANLTGVNLRGANLSSADVENAYLRDTWVKSFRNNSVSPWFSTDLSKVRNLSQEQLNSMYGDCGAHGTLIPKHLSYPDHWPEVEGEDWLEVEDEDEQAEDLSPIIDDPDPQGVRQAFSESGATEFGFRDAKIYVGDRPLNKPPLSPNKADLKALIFGQLELIKNLKEDISAQERQFSEEAYFRRLEAYADLLNDSENHEVYWYALDNQIQRLIKMMEEEDAENTFPSDIYEGLQLLIERHQQMEPRIRPDQTDVLPDPNIRLSQEALPELRDMVAAAQEVAQIPDLQHILEEPAQDLIVEAVEDAANLVDRASVYMFLEHEDSSQKKALEKAVLRLGQIMAGLKSALKKFHSWVMNNQDEVKAYSQLATAATKIMGLIGAPALLLWIMSLII